MDGYERKPEKKNWQYPLRGVGSFFILFLLKSLTTPRLISFINGEITDRVPSQLFYAFATLGIILIYNSVVHTFTFYDKDSFEIFKKRKLQKIRFGTELKAILKSKEFWLETLPVITLAVLFSLFGGFYETVYTVFFVDKTPAWAFSLIPLTSVPILLFSVSLLCRYEIHRYWYELIKKGEENKVESKVKFAFKLIIVFLMYPLLFPYTPYVLFLLLTFFGIVGALVSVLSIIGFIAALIGLILGIIGLLKWKNFRLRKKFMASVKAVAEEKGEFIEVFDKEQAEVRGYDFTLTSGGKTYSVKILNVLSPLTPLYFTSSQDAYFLHRVGTKEHHASLENHFNYSFVGEGQKLIVLIRFPKRIFVTEYGATGKLFSGDKIWNYIIFNTRSFLGAQDRECLYRSNDENR